MIQHPNDLIAPRRDLEEVLQNEGTSVQTRVLAIQALHLDRIASVLERTAEPNCPHGCWSPLVCPACCRDLVMTAAWEVKQR